MVNSPGARVVVVEALVPGPDADVRLVGCRAGEVDGEDVVAVEPLVQPAAASRASPVTAAAAPRLICGRPGRVTALAFLTSISTTP
jgi:hypothetical protein